MQHDCFTWGLGNRGRGHLSPGPPSITAEVTLVSSSILFRAIFYGIIIGIASFFHLIFFYCFCIIHITFILNIHFMSLP